MTSDEYYATLTVKQKNALISLERAFSRCAALNLRFVMMDRNLHAAREKDLPGALPDDPGYNGYSIDQYNSVVISSEGLIDCGAW